MALAAKKPAAKPALAKPAKVAKPVKAAKPAKPAKEIKGFEEGEIVIFKAYKQKQDGQMFTEGEELAVVGQQTKDGNLLVATVKSSQYHKYKEDPDSVNGEELLVDEVRRTSKTVPPLYHLPVIGNMANVLKTQGGDPLEIAKDLYSKANEAFFYYGGILAKLWKEIDPETDKPLFCGYEDDKDRNFEASKEGFEAFVRHNFGTDMSFRKAAYLMSVYDQFSVLDDAAEIIKELPKVGWWKAAMLAQYVTNDNAKELVEVAQEQSAEKLEETLKTSYTTEGATARGNPASRATIKRTSFQFKLYEDRGIAIETIMKAAAKQLGIQDLNEVFEHIVHAWASDHMAETEKKAVAARERATTSLKRAGVKLPNDHPAASKEKAAA